MRTDDDEPNMTDRGRSAVSYRTVAGCVTIRRMGATPALVVAGEVVTEDALLTRLEFWEVSIELEIAPISWVVANSTGFTKLERARIQSLNAAKVTRAIAVVRRSM